MSLKTKTQSHSGFFCESTKLESTWINLGHIPANTMHPANVVLMLARHLRRRTNIKTPFVYCHVFAGMDTMDIVLIMYNIVCTLMSYAQLETHDSQINP